MGLPHLAKPLVNVPFGQSRSFDERQRALQSVCDTFEHGRGNSAVCGAFRLPSHSTPWQDIVYHDR